jgi:hypothetical protein
MLLALNLCNLRTPVRTDGAHGGLLCNVVADFVRHLRGGLLEEKGRRMLKTETETEGLVLCVYEACCKLWQ